MSWRSSLSPLLILLCGCSPGASPPVSGIPEPRSGYHFQSQDTQNLQDDDFANPGMLWVDGGMVLWTEAPETGKPACADCHDTADMSGVASRYPAYDKSLDTVLNLEARINYCRTERQGEPAYPWESEPLLSLTAYVAHQSRGVPVEVDISGPARPFFDAGETYFHERRGQMNLACVHCHEHYVGQMLRGDKLSQGQPVGYPIYRLEWQTLGSLQRRLRFCNTGVRAEPLAFGAQTWTNVELYLKWRATGLPGEVPAVRR